VEYRCDRQKSQLGYVIDDWWSEISVDVCEPHISDANITCNISPQSWQDKKLPRADFVVVVVCFWQSFVVCSWQVVKQTAVFLL